jgi:hypothetical protein
MKSDVSERRTGWKPNLGCILVNVGIHGMFLEHLRQPVRFLTQSGLEQLRARNSSGTKCNTKTPEPTGLEPVASISLPAKLPADGSEGARESNERVRLITQV